MTRERKWKQYGDLESDDADLGRWLTSAGPSWARRRDEPEVPPESPGPAPEQMVTITLSARCVAELVNLARNINVAFPLPEVPDA